jgi:hypothetical protein
VKVEIITRSFVAVLGAVAVVAGAAGPGWQDAPDYLAVFAPAAHRDAYRTAVSPLDLDAVLQALAGDPSLALTPGAWTARAELPADAFGRAGTYNRWALVRLYGSRQPRVARGARLEGGRVVESWTLVSPYPSADLTRLEPGTLRIVLGIAP